MNLWRKDALQSIFTSFTGLSTAKIHIRNTKSRFSSLLERAKIKSFEIYKISCWNFFQSLHGKTMIVPIKIQWFRSFGFNSLIHFYLTFIKAVCVYQTHVRKVIALKFDIITFFSFSSFGCVSHFNSCSKCCFLAVTCRKKNQHRLPHKTISVCKTGVWMSKW